jgi:glucosamine 6-phosphate synthetase-like amidotransferase/phosphosugar isomerase protein
MKLRITFPPHHDGADDVSPILTVIPLELLASHLAVTPGRDVDKAAQLANSSKAIAFVC